jgi:hypothetical protein
MSRHNATAIKNVIIKQRWDELGPIAVPSSAIKQLKREETTGSTQRTTTFTPSFVQ